jgi:hypothetical protein
LCRFQEQFLASKKRDIRIDSFRPSFCRFNARGMQHVYTITHTFLDLIQRRDVFPPSLNETVLLETPKEQVRAGRVSNPFEIQNWPIRNFAPRGEFLSPGGEVIPWGRNCNILGDFFTNKCLFTLIRGQSSPLGAQKLVEKLAFDITALTPMCTLGIYFFHSVYLNLFT